jgi:dynein light intermediate chain, axonemal
VGVGVWNHAPPSPTPAPDLPSLPLSPFPPFPRADELLREVTLDLPERGLVLLRIRDEARMTRDAYKTLYDASITFGVRKQLQAEEGIPELEQAVASLQERKKDLEGQVQALRARIDVVERRQAERRVLDDKRRAEELSFLKHQAKHLDGFLKSMPKA